MAQEIVINFDEEGNPIVEAHGIKGTSCKQMTAFIEKGLGKKVGDSNTREFYEKGANEAYVRR
jgi:hypothetical protein